VNLLRNVSLLAQADFSSLEIAVDPDADIRPLDGYHAFKNLERAGSEGSLKRVTTCGTNEISAESAPFICATFLPDYTIEIKQMSHSNESVHEPMRCISKSAPPKRFYRSFWRSLTQRIVRQNKSVIIGRAATLSQWPAHRRLNIKLPTRQSVQRSATPSARILRFAAVSRAASVRPETSPSHDRAGTSPAQGRKPAHHIITLKSKLHDSLWKSWLSHAASVAKAALPVSASKTASKTS
jgi:hypothetical protein